MERLQTALKKARDLREPGLLLPPGSHAVEEAAVPTEVSAAPWEALEELHIIEKHLRRNRITTLDGKADSAPFDLLRTRILQQAKHHDWRRIALVSPHSDCGKSTAAANLAFSLARQPSLHSMIFDLDLRRAGLSAIMGQHPPFSMADVLEKKARFSDQARRLGGNVAFGFNSRARARNPSEILQSPQTSEILDQIAAQYAPDIMLFDMPPLMASDDNFGFLQNVDCALIMITAEKTTMSQIDVAERHIAELTNVMGIVLNKCHYTKGAHGQEYDYY